MILSTVLITTVEQVLQFQNILKEINIPGPNTSKQDLYLCMNTGKSKKKKIRSSNILQYSCHSFCKEDATFSDSQPVLNVPPKGSVKNGEISIIICRILGIFCPTADFKNRSTEAE